MIKRSGGLTPIDQVKSIEGIMEANESLINRFAWEFGRHQRWNTPTSKRDYSRFAKALGNAIRDHLKVLPQHTEEDFKLINRAIRQRIRRRS